MRRRPSCRRAPEAQRGVALVLVLWLLVLLTVIASSHAQNMRIETQLASHQLDAARARALAETGVYRAIMELLVTGDANRWAVDGSPVAIETEAGNLSIVIRDASGLIDLNTVQAPLLDKVMVAAGVEAARREALVAATLDWRDQDEFRHLSGAEADDYRRAGLSWTPRNGRFSSVEEFRYVLGMSSELFERLAPYLTVWSGQRSVDPAFAPPWLAAVLFGADTGAPPTESGRPTRSANSVYHIAVKSRTAGGAIASLVTVVRITGATERPYTILSWQEPGRPVPVNAGERVARSSALALPGG
jgi:general secretion pathway protein K